MKKNITKILMLLAATISLGTFVSCKDTNEDLYNELRTELINENMTLAEALTARIGELEELIADIKSCECDTTLLLSWVNAEDKYLQHQIDALNTAIEELGKAENYYTKAEIDKMFSDLADLYAKLADFAALKKDFEERITQNTIAITLLQRQVDGIEEWKEDIASCKCDLEKLGILEGKIIEAETNAKEALNGLKAIEDIAKDAKSIAENAQSTADQAKILAEEAKTAATEAKTLAEAFKDLYETAANNATEAKTMATEAKTLAEENKGKIEKLEEDLKTLDTKVNTISETANEALSAAAAAYAKAEENKKLIDALTKRVTTNEANIENLKKSVEKLEDLAEKVGANTEAISTLKDTVKKLGDKYDEMKSTLDKVKQQVEDCLTICATNLEVAKAELRVEIQELETKLMKELAANSQAIEDLVTRHEADVEWIKEALRQIAEKAEGFVSMEDLEEILNTLRKLEETDKGLDERLGKAETKLKDLEPKVKTLEVNISGLQASIQKAEETLAYLTPMVERLTGDVKAIQEYLSKQVTSIIIQGTHNPLFGSLSIPGTDIMSTSLVAFYGLPTTDVEFPTSDDANYVRKSEVLTDKDMEMLGGLEVFEASANLPLLNEGSNAGKVYVTINPNSADLTGLKLSIVNTLDEESPIKLSPIKKCEEKLQSGWTRANNGFYVAEASVTPRAVMTENGGLNFDKETIKELYKDTKDQLGVLANDFSTGKLNLSELATDVYSVIREMKVDKSGLKCTYTTTGADGAETEHSVYSQYDLAAIFLNPLNLSWGKDFNYETLPGYERAENLLNRISNAVKKRIDVIFNEVINVGVGDAKDFITHFQIDELTYIGEASELISKFEARVSHIVLNGTGYQLLVPGAGAFDVMFNKNLTANGAAVSIPAEVAYDEQNVTLSRAAVVIGGDIISGMNATLVIPAKGTEDDKVAAYASFVLSKESAPITVSGNQITMTTTDGDYTIANVNGTSINTNECTDRVILSNVVGNGGSLRLPIAVEISNDLRDLLERQGGTINDIVNELNDMLNKINNYHGTINGWVDKGFEDYLKKYLDKVNTTVVNFINHINHKFGPFMVASNNNKGFKYLSNSKNYPTVLSADGLAIYPTTKNMELIVPLARKHVAVTNVFKGNESAQNGNADCKARLQAINSAEKLNTVIDGTVRKIDVSNMVSGYTYEIAYSVLDFEGNISTQKYYVTIK